MTYIPADIKSLTIIEFIAVHGMEMCYCELRKQSVGSFGRKAIYER